MDNDVSGRCAKHNNFIMSVKESLEGFGKRVVQQSKSNLSKLHKHDTGKLYNSIAYKVTVHKNSFSLSIVMEDYGAFIDKGVKGKTSSALAPSSPFRFGTGTGAKGGLTDATIGWVQRRRIQFKDRKTGKFYTYKQTAFVIARSIYNKGIKTTNFMTKPFENEFKKLPKQIIDDYALTVENMIKHAFKK